MATAVEGSDAKASDALVEDERGLAVVKTTFKDQEQELLLSVNDDAEVVAETAPAVKSLSDAQDPALDSDPARTCGDWP